MTSLTERRMTSPLSSPVRSISFAAPMQGGERIGAAEDDQLEPAVVGSIGWRGPIRPGTSSPAFATSTR